MTLHRIQNFDSLATSFLRRQALEIAEAGLEAIDTEKIIAESVRLNGAQLTVKDQIFDLKKFAAIRVIGFGKASCSAAAALEKILGDKIRDGVAIGVEKNQCELIQTYAGTHPRPSEENVKISEKIYKLSRSADEKDLVIVIVSGGGSALLCWPEEECRQGQNLYDKFLSSGGTINELNIVRKHISLLKGGGLAKTLYPATVIGLIFSDIPGNHYEEVASGPTFQDESTVEDARTVIKKYNLGEFNLVETSKEDKYFKNVHNIVLVSNITALAAMAEKARDLGFDANIISSDIYDPLEQAVKQLITASQPGLAVLAGGEPMLKIEKGGGSGGRCSFMGLEFIDKLEPGSAAVFIASDGTDNNHNAGVIVDSDSFERSKRAGFNLEDAKYRYDSRTFFDTLGDLIITGPTGANVSDLMILIKSR